jgi:hypothetical protein
MLLKCAQQQLVSDTILPGKLTFYGRILKSIVRVALVCKAADEIITIS